jgi:hypothetical protein
MLTPADTVFIKLLMKSDIREVRSFRVSARQHVSKPPAVAAEADST